MPELPDIQVISENLDKIFRLKKLSKIIIYKDKKLNAPVEEFCIQLNNQILENVSRNGKELLLSFLNKTKLGIHLMLKGEIHLNSEINIKHKVFDLIFVDKTGFSVTDFMGQAKPILNPDMSNVPDALNNLFNFEYLKKIISKHKNETIKKILINQIIVRGIGNAYVDEILWESRVSPFSIGSKIPDNNLKDIISKTKKVLLESIQEIKSIKPGIISGEVRSFFKIHTPNKEFSPTGQKIMIIEIDKKKTFYTDEQVSYR